MNKASVLASILLARASWDQKRIDGALQLGETRYINIPGRIPIYLYYQTAWVDNKISLIFAMTSMAMTMLFMGR